MELFPGSGLTGKPRQVWAGVPDVTVGVSVPAPSHLGQGCAAWVWFECRGLAAGMVGGLVVTVQRAQVFQERAMTGSAFPRLGGTVRVHLLSLCRDPYSLLFTGAAAVPEARKEEKQNLPCVLISCGF